MTFSINISESTAAKLRDRAAAAGQDVSEYAAHLIADALNKPALDEVLAPFRSDVATSNMSDDELDRFFEDLRDRVWRDKQTTQA